jgi:UMF1 family MFS transporter
VVVLKPGLFGIPESEKSLPPQISFLMVGLWWIGFAQIPFKVLPEAKPAFKARSTSSGYLELAKVWKQVKESKILNRFLYAFFFYSIGVQTIMLVATAFGAKVLKMETGELIATILIIQLVAIAGANLMSALAKRIGNIKVLMLVVCIWIGVCITAYFIQNKFQFFALAGLVGLIMGGIQSLSRSTYSKLLPENTPDTASFFSFYDVTEKIAIVIGLAVFAFIEELSNIRNSAISLTVFFIVGLVILFFAEHGKHKTNSN